MPGSTCTRAALRLALVALALGAPSRTLAQAHATPSPRPGVSAAAPDSTTVSEEAVEAGRKVFHGAGQCYTCHGPQLQGGIGPTLRAHQWKDATGGELPAILRVITQGVSGTLMVAHPGGIDDAQARAVAAYVWAVSHGKAQP